MNTTNKPAILIVDSDILVRHPLAEYLRECGYHVLEASTAAEARTFIADAEVSIDAVLADVAGPGEGGFALASWIRANHPHIEIALAGTLDKAAQKAGDLCREGPTLTKPYDHQFILDHIRRLLAARDQRRGG
ncbi:MAG TPA: response regulator [Aliidongia sp.]|nr:response regulator [Aliidongia sp.]